MAKEGRIKLKCPHCGGDITARVKLPEDKPAKDSGKSVMEQLFGTDLGKKK